ncbi:Putative transposase (identified by ISEscan HMM) [Escherichia coli]|nr:Putative transposase (identified by ISEscan HMM) [Escherichia coli]
MVTSDDRSNYAREVPKEKHLTGKIFTQRIELNNLLLAFRGNPRKVIVPSLKAHVLLIGSTTKSYNPAPGAFQSGDHLIIIHGS